MVFGLVHSNHCAPVANTQKLRMLKEGSLIMNKIALTLTTVGLLSSGAVQAALVDRGGGLLYDTLLNVTWLQDANYAKTSGFDTDGLMDWGTAKSWASNLVYAGYSDWRLPTSDPACFAGDVIGKCASSEMGKLYEVTLGNISAYQPEAINHGLKNNGQFQNLNEGHGYWSSTELFFDSNQASDFAFYFHFAGGGQAYGLKVGSHYAMAVRDGDVAAVPEPKTYALLVAGLGIMGALAHRKQK